ncbi:MAG: Eco57I restriction-modification methylase domain-containing protein [Spirochaetia bacterium]|jgi:superfamily II DNA or RNA helicase|nr:Eco57I restriction-modification methylase domain-containing protein [Spirochaetia bacterium]
MAKGFEAAFSYLLIYVFTINDENHRGCLKIGKASLKLDDDSQYASLRTPNSSLLNKAAKQRINSYTKTAGINYQLLYTELAERQINEHDGIYLKYFEDHKVHEVLKNSGIKNAQFDGSKEWFRTDLDTVKNAIKAVKEGRKSLTSAEITTDHIPIEFRPEQKEAINMTIARFRKGNKILWNAKMRFGKTLSTLEVIKEENFKKTLILTHRPVVDEGWHEDFNKIFWDSNYTYFEKGTKEASIQQYILEDVPFVLFASIQDLRGSMKVGGKFDKNDIFFKTNWDCVVIDEAHEGTKTFLGDEVLQEIIKEKSYGKTKQIYLSGTPFNLVNDFNEDEVYTWDYVMEQKAKSEWDIIHCLDYNPYEGLPKLSIFTYDIADAIPGYEDIENKAFNFREFFRVWTGIVQVDGKLVPQESAIGRFIHENDVKSFITLLRLKNDNSNYPFSKDTYREYFRHTLWMLPGVKEASAMEQLLKEDKVFGNFQIVNVAGNSPSGESENALERLNNAISEHPEQTRTITLSCGRLTTGVTVKPWTAVLMLSGTTSTAASMYLQTIFRVQSPANIDGKIKDRCYVFDFAPDRTLQMVAEAGKLGTRPGTNTDEAKMREFLNFCPVISIQGSKMKNYDVNSLLRQLKRYYATRVVQNGFDDIKLYNDKLLKMTDYDKNKFEELKKIVGQSKATDIKKTIIISESGLGPEEQEAAEEAEKKKRQKKELTEEDKEALKKLKEAKEAKSKAISILRAISIRIPLLIYGTEKDIDENITIDQFADFIDEESWQEFMPKDVTKEKFNGFCEYYDKDIFIEAGNQIRRKVKAADKLNPTERVKKLAQIFATFKNPDKETVLTPWRVVNMHISDCLGGYDFFDNKHVEMIPEPRFVDHGEITTNTLNNTNAQILEINSKSGLYPLYVAYSIYRKRLESVSENGRTEEIQDKFWRQTIEENVFVICKTEMAKYITKRTLLGYKEGKINAHYFEDLVNQFKNKSDHATRKIISATYWGKVSGGEMKFDAIVGNPPYQAFLGGASPLPIYHYFVNQAKRLKPRYISMITPARWFNAGTGLDEFRNEMLHDNRIIELYDYIDATYCFQNVEIKGGIQYFLWDINYHGDCNITSHYTDGKVFKSKRPLLEPGIDSFVRDSRVIPILKKVREKKEDPFSLIVSSRDPFGYDIRLPGSYKIAEHKYSLQKDSINTVEFYYNGWRNNGVGYVSLNSIGSNSQWIDFYKVLIPKAWGTGNERKDWLHPFVVGPHSVCTETYLVVGPFKEKIEAENAVSYINTKFFHLMVSILKISQNAAKGIFEFVPVQNFSNPWTDKDLYKKYGLTQEEIDFIESTIKPI